MKINKHPCLNCGKKNPMVNYCDSKCHIEHAKKNGAVEHLPNNLPVACITGDKLLEHEHGDHPDYKFPVTIDYVGPYDRSEASELRWFGKKATKENYFKYKREIHALIYTDGNVAITMYEYCYAMFYLQDGRMQGGSIWKADKYKLSEESRKKIIDFTQKQKSKAV